MASLLVVVSWLVACGGDEMTPPPDATTQTDAGPRDSGTDARAPIDASVDFGSTPDASPSDGGPIDGGPVDAGPTRIDSGGATDAGPRDAGPPDSGSSPFLFVAPMPAFITCPHQNESKRLTLRGTGVAQLDDIHRDANGIVATGTVTAGTFTYSTSATSFTAADVSGILIHLDGMGAHRWTRLVPNMRRPATARVGDSIYLAGQIQGRVTIDASTVGEDGHVSLLVAQFGANGALRWARALRQAQASIDTRHIAATSDRVCVVADIELPAQWSASRTLTGAPGGAVVASCLSDTGAFIFDTVIPTDIHLGGGAIAIDSSHVYLASGAHTTFTFGGRLAALPTARGSVFFIATLDRTTGAFTNVRRGDASARVEGMALRGGQVTTLVSSRLLTELTSPTFAVPGDIRALTLSSSLASGSVAQVAEATTRSYRHDSITSPTAGRTFYATTFGGTGTIGSAPFSFTNRTAVVIDVERATLIGQVDATTSSNGTSITNGPCDTVLMAGFWEGNLSSSVSGPGAFIHAAPY